MEIPSVASLTSSTEVAIPESQGRSIHVKNRKAKEKLHQDMASKITP